MSDKAVLSSAARGDLPDGAFACPEKRLYPHHFADGRLDLAHLRNALSRIGDPTNDQCGKGHLEAHARAAGIGDRGKALLPLKAQPLDDSEETAWWEGRSPRRLLAIPFGGPIPSPFAPRGMDLDGEWFSERTDIYGGVKALMQTPERMVDWHHNEDPLGRIRGAVGKALLSPEPDADGYWVDFWWKRGEERVQLIRKLAERGAQLYGSSQAAFKAVEPTGEITIWPYYLQTISSSPQNTYSVLRPKALLNDTLDPALQMALAELDDLSASLAVPSAMGVPTASAGLDLPVMLAPFERALMAARRRKGG